MRGIIKCFGEIDEGDIGLVVVMSIGMKVSNELEQLGKT